MLIFATVKILYSDCYFDLVIEIREIFKSVQGKISLSSALKRGRSFFLYTRFFAEPL